MFSVAMRLLLGMNIKRSVPKNAEIECIARNGSVPAAKKINRTAQYSTAHLICLRLFFFILGEFFPCIIRTSYARSARPAFLICLSLYIRASAVAINSSSVPGFSGS